MKHLKVFEAFEDIDSICKRYNIRNYTINSDGSVDVNGAVYLSDERLTKLPLKFGKVTGGFYCGDNQLITLEGAPNEVGGYFCCNYNQLTTLEGSPDHVGGDFYCDSNQLTTLNGGPSYVGRDFDCNNNQLTTLEGGPIEVGGDFNCYDNPIHSIYKLFTDHKAFMYSLDYNYFRGTNIIKSRFQEACEEAGIEMPEEIQGYNYI